MTGHIFRLSLLYLTLSLTSMACVLGGAASTPATSQPGQDTNTIVPATPTEPPPTPTRSPTVTPLASIPIVNEACANLVLNTLDAASKQCGDLSEGSVCFAGAPAEVVPSSAFSRPGDAVPLASVQQLHTGQVDVIGEQWGAALIELPAQAGDASASLMLVGDVTLNTVSESDPPAFWVSTGSSPPQCTAAPHALILNTPEEQTVDLTVNDVRLSADGATAVIRAALNGEMSVLVLSGSVIASTQGSSQTLEMGQMTSLTLGGDSALEATTPPSAPVAFDVEQIEFMPFHVIHPPIEIQSGERWTGTGIELRAGQSFMVMAAGLMKTVDTLPWSSPIGHSAADCLAAGRGDWDCRCRTLPEWGTCTLDEVPSMILIGQVGGVQPFVVGSGGMFTAKVDGELELGPNDNFFDDNLATYHAIVVVLDG